MVVIRLSRGGVRHRPFFSIMVSDSRSRRDGRCIEKVGFYDPVSGGRAVRLRVNQARVQYWISQGAQVSLTVRRLLKMAVCEATSAS